MRFKAVSTLFALSVSLVVLSGCAQTSPRSQDGECSTMSAALASDAVGEPSAREALRKWVEQAKDLPTDLPASDWVEKNSSTDRVRFQGGEKVSVEVTHLSGGWLISEVSTCS
jgi:hypothetical protein